MRRCVLSFEQLPAILALSNHPRLADRLVSWSGQARHAGQKKEQIRSDWSSGPNQQVVCSSSDSHSARLHSVISMHEPMYPRKIPSDPNRGAALLTTQ